MLKNSEIIHAIKEGLTSLEKQIPIEASTKRWTEAVKTELCRIGRARFDCKVYAQDVPRNQKDGGEWLYDVTWLAYESGSGELIEAPLVAECEWGDEPHIQDDFEKLLLACARVRVMIVDAGTDRDYSDTIAKLLAGKVKKFEGFRAEDAWLLAVVEQKRDDGWSFRYYSLQD